ncbi:MAG TPA: polysaccharide deacetylase family protein, partial [Planctomycetaceae bacterium]|nr:polysaccharide deacetylase family protein [Planctomycetaceae bacterium]
LMYHNVVPDGAAFPDLSPAVTSYFVGASVFARQMERVARTAMPFRFSDVERFFRSPPARPWSRRGRLAVHVTFDDGWLGSVDLASAVLEECGLSATLFVTTGLIDQPRFLGRRLLNRLPPTTFRVGSHGHSHRFLSQLSMAAIRQELQRSKAMLEDIVGSEVTALSVPGGAADERVIRVAEECGYRYVFTSRVVVNTPKTGPYDIGRLAVKRSTSMARFERWLAGNLWTERMRTRLLRMIGRAVGQNSYAMIRRRLLRERPGQREMIDLYRAAQKGSNEEKQGCAPEPALGGTSCVGG